MQLLGLHADVLECVVFPLLPLDALLSMRLVCRVAERLTRRALCGCVAALDDADGATKLLLSFGAVFTDLRNPRRDLLSASLFWGTVAVATDAADVEHVTLIARALRSKHWERQLLSLIGPRGCPRWHHAYAVYRLAGCLLERGEVERVAALLRPLVETCIDVNTEAADGFDDELRSSILQLHGHALLALGDARQDRELLRQCIEAFRESGASAVAHYNIACAHCLLGDADEARRWLRRAVVARRGLPSRAHMLADAQLRPIAKWAAAIWPSANRYHDDSDGDGDDDDNDDALGPLSEAAFI